MDAEQLYELLRTTIEDAGGNIPGSADDHLAEACRAVTFGDEDDEDDDDKRS